MQVTRFPLVAGLALLTLGACQSGFDAASMGRMIEAQPEVIRANDGPPNAPEGSCWGRDTTPAKIETVTEQIMLQPAEISANGQVLSPAVFKTETHQQITRERSEVWFETPCPEDLTPQFIASVQRALSVRGYYSGRITGVLDRATLRAVRRYQAPQGLDSGVLSLAAARKLGLVAVAREVVSPLATAATEARSSL